MQRILSAIKHHWEIAWLVAVLLLASLGAAFAWGVAVGNFKLFPYSLLNSAWLAASRLMVVWESPHHLSPIRHDRPGVEVLQRERMQPGVTLLTSYWKDGDDWHPGIRLIDADGNLLHEWPVYPERIWPDSPYSDYIRGTKNTRANFVHGTALLPGGDIVFNIEYLGLVRFDACGNVVWKLSRRTHHSVYQDAEGNFWVAALTWRDHAMPEYPGMKPQFVDESILQVSPDGKVLREIPILDAIYRSGYEGLLMLPDRTGDVTHLNDVELLEAGMADAFDMFNAGDILISMRNIDTVMVLDGKTGKVKWHFTHALIRQHDPDFTADGHISVFDNRNDDTETGSGLGGSRILSIDPATQAVKTVYPVAGSDPFYSAYGGKHQYLENGNLLLTEARSGQVLEVTAAGEPVWSWTNEPWDEKNVAEVLEGTRYPAAMAEFTTDHCRQAAAGSN
jgi:outer membrane protein assembly factor BamB